MYTAEQYFDHCSKFTLKQSWMRTFIVGKKYERDSHLRKSILAYRCN